MVTTKEIGKIFAEARQKRQMSVLDVTRKSRIHPDVVRDIENGVFDRLGKTYMKSFLRKYSQFLDLDTESIIKKYESVSGAISAREFNLGVMEEKEGASAGSSDIFSFLRDKRLQTAVIAVLSVVLLSLVFILIGMVRSRIRSAPPKKTPVQSARVQEPKIEKKALPVKVEAPEKVIASSEPVQKPAAASTAMLKPASSVVLTIRARDEVWLQVQKGSEVVFSGTLKAGDSKTWNSDGALTVWTGKAEMLDFIVNTRRIGMIAAGVVKNITVSSEGIKIGDVWVARLS